MIQDVSREAPETAAVLRSLLGDSADPEGLKCAHLVCLNGLDLGRRFHLTLARTDVGRGEDVDVRIRDRAVSRMHARIRRTSTGYFLEDNGSPNGVFLDGQRIGGPTLLEEGAVIELGHALLRFKGPWREPEPPDAALAAREAPAATADEPEPENPGLAHQGRKTEATLICFGAVLAVVGVVMTYGFAAS